MTHRLRAPIVVATALTLLGALAPLRASGSTIDDKKQEAAQLAQEIQSNGDRIDALGEAYNGAVLEYQNAQSGVAEREAALRGRGGAATTAEQSRRRSRRGALPGRAGPHVAVAQHEHPVGERAGCAHAVRSGRDRQRRATHLEPRAREARPAGPAQATRQAGEGREAEARLHRVGAEAGRAGQLARERAAVAGEGPDRDADRAGRRQSPQAAGGARSQLASQSSSGNGASRVPASDVGGEHDPQPAGALTASGGRHRLRRGPARQAVPVRGRRARAPTTAPASR